jgi:hypothetical protein
LILSGGIEIGKIDVCLLAKIESLKSEREGMIAENKQCELTDKSLSYLMVKMPF